LYVADHPKGHNFGLNCAPDALASFGRGGTRIVSENP
jgi:hypothetical protein